MFKKRFLGILLALFAVVAIPSFALAQTTEDDMLYEDTSIEYDFDWDDFEETYDTYDTYDEMDDAALGALATVLSGFAIIWVLFSAVFGIAVYVYTSLAYMKIAQKLNHPNPWFAWVPILNLVLHFQLAGMSGWFVLLMFVPLANLIVYVMAMMKICERRGMEQLLGLLVLVPLANYILLGILAWKKEDGVEQPVQQAPQQEIPPQEETTQPTEEKKDEEESYLRPQPTREAPKEE